MILNIDPKVDYAFKRVYGREENRDVLASALEAVLAGTEFGTITDLEILNPYNDRDTFDDKLSIVDVRARQRTGEFFNVEMQMLKYKALPQRLLYYWSVSYSDQLDKGHSYSLLKPTIVICFADYDVFPGHDGYHSRFRVADPEGRVLCPDLEIHILEIPKAPADPKSVVTPLEQWLFFLRNAKDIDSANIPSCLTLTAIHKAIEELHMITQTEADYQRYLTRRLSELDQQSRLEEQEADLEEARRAGLEQGLEQGLAKGIEKGIEKGRLEGLVLGRIQVLESLLGLAASSMDQFDSRSMDELLQIEAELKAKLANRS